jgi:hypothetical protein
VSSTALSLLSQSPAWNHEAAQQGDEPVEALELKVLHDVPIFKNVRFAGYRDC